MANLKLRSTTSATDPGSTTAKGSALTHSEMDSNFILLNNEKVDSASPTLTGTVTLSNNGILQLNEATANGSNYVQIKSPASLSDNYVLTLPTTDGDSGQVLTTDGSGVLTWTAKTVDTTNLVDDTTPQLGGDLDVNSNKIVSVSNGDITIEPNGTGTTKITAMRADSGTFADLPSLVRQTTSHYNYSLEIASDSTSTARAADQVGGAFGFTHKADSVSDYYVGSINGVVGDEGTFGSAGENNNAIRLYTFEDQSGFALNIVGEFRYASASLMKEKLKFDYTANKVTIEAPTSNDDIEIKTNGSTGYIILSNLPTSATGLPTGAIYNDSGTLKIA
jgi:hypothetical protein